MSADAAFQPGSLVRARGREWVVLPGSDGDLLLLRPLAGGEESLVYLPLEPTPVEQARFPLPDPAKAGATEAGRLLHDALLMKLRAGAGPFRGFGNIAVEPRAYQLVPLLMALRQPVVRLLVADDVGIGKTIEAGLIARELLDRGEIFRMAVLCPPHLCEQWQHELAARFHIRAEIVRTSTAGRLERGLPAGRSLFEVVPFTVVSLDYIKRPSRLDEFQRACPEFVIVDEAHTCTRGPGRGRHQRHLLLRGLAEDPARHLVLLTATPHSGDEESFHGLLALLDPEFSGLREATGERRARLREKLARHFVQRRRPDIEEWQEARLFPERLRRERTYRLTGAWGRIFNDVLEYARELVASAAGRGRLQRRMNEWAALALLRCISSSPAAAVQALSTRITAIAGMDDPETAVERLDEEGRARVLDGDVDTDLALLADSVPAARVGDDAEYLAILRSYAEDLLGPGNDPKLAALIDEIGDLVADGFAPVVFCRYIATAHYLAGQLAAAFPARRVEAVTGELTPAEREERVLGLRGEDAILVATDCLSEGINLQEIFDAVVHYDLSWNPTRHEQREGRVDRFGQQSPQVRAVMLYGEDNPVDGAVLRVIIEKADRIRRELGVAVPMPDDADKVTKAVMQAVLFSGRRPAWPEGRDPRQLSLFDEPAASLDELDADMDRCWENVRDRVARNRTIFAQRRLKPAEVLPEWEKAVAALGTEADVERFVAAAARRLGAPLEPRGHGWRLHVRHLPEQVRGALAGSGFDPDRPLDIGFRYPVAAGCRYVHRTHPLVAALADHLAEIGLEEERPDLAARSGAVFTRAVTVRTIVCLLRLRCQVTLLRPDGERHSMLAEEALPVALDPGGRIRAQGREAVFPLMRAGAARNMEPGLRVRHVARAVEEVAAAAAVFDDLARRRAGELLADHRRVRDAAHARGAYRVTPLLPADVIGVYVLVPARTLPL